MACDKCPNGIDNWCKDCNGKLGSENEDLDMCDVCNAPLFYDEGKLKRNDEGDFVCSNCEGV